MPVFTQLGRVWKWRAKTGKEAGCFAGPLARSE